MEVRVFAQHFGNQREEQICEIGHPAALISILPHDEAVEIPNMQLKPMCSYELNLSNEVGRELVTTMLDWEMFYQGETLAVG